jgi:hypothetical protein
MWQTSILALLAGLFAANAVPHFVKGVTGERFKTPLGASPVINVVSGWAMFVLAGVLLGWAHVDRFPVRAAVAGAAGALVAALIHARMGALGRRV